MKTNSIAEPGVIAPEPTNAARSRDRVRTLQELQYAMLRVKNKGAKMSISAVAREAGVNASLLHNTYPDIAEDIREQMGRATRVQRDQKAADLVKARETIRDLRRKIDEMEVDIAKSTSLNLALEDEVTLLKAAVSGKLILYPFPPKKP
ncbi:TetR family transcriptional regulator [Polaromonas sp. UC242_47]|uniref:TetR family transcriptional regulator n=1 Tax=Polaromonas sp. UC242_47 TaxID=3374626 RepID=UPI00379EF616